MENPNAADTLEELLLIENAALEKHDPAICGALLEQKLAAAQILSASETSPEQLQRLRELAADNRRLLERAINVQSLIINMVARAAQTPPTHSRYGAAGRTVRSDTALAIARQA